MTKEKEEIKKTPIKVQKEEAKLEEIDTRLRRLK